MRAAARIVRAACHTVTADITRARIPTYTYREFASDFRVVGGIAGFAIYARRANGKFESEPALLNVTMLFTYYCAQGILR